ncbi:PREDICTED: tudor domain-containing protein 1 [Thamnophis sirtalis]|uniref:Tudor domain-containing protein 1 n=1 Tax=Thamnophis sirtalis TaxID=35019 RepID=A0A6I9YJH0_9SAUR|nr:PREDICTED: tudor domain-containing protein 1 [Thamnophis sirtalis]
MEQRLQIKDLKSPNQSLRSPSTSPNFKNIVLVDDKVPPLLNNFSICEQAKLFAANWNDSVENIHDGYDHKTVSLNTAGVGMKGPPANSLEFVNHLSPFQSPGSKLNDPEGNFKVMNNLLSSTKKINPVSDSAVIQAMHLSTSDKVLPNSYNSQLSPLYQPTCHFCGLFGSLRCIQCKQVSYCSASCQMKDWQIHNNVCKPTKANTNKAEYHRESLDESNKKENILPANTKNVAQGKKIMLSDLNNLGLKKNMTIKGTITDFNNPSEFYIQVNSPEVQSNIRKLTVKLKNYKGINQEYTPVKGEVGVAKYTLDQTWCRVLIKEIDIITKSTQVLYIDYGKRENILLHKIKGLPEDISQIPPCAIKCRVANVLDAKQWNESYKNIIAPILIGKYCSLIITDVSMEDMPCFTVDAVLSDYEDNQWYRATVISFISEKMALVGYIDYGNVEMLQLNRLRPIVQKLMELPMQAMNCTLAGVKPVSGTWSAEATFAMKQLVQNKVVAIKVTDKKMNTFVVEITDKSVTPSINISKCLLELGYAVEEAPIVLKQNETMKETNGEKQEPVNWSWVTLTDKQVVNVMVSVLYNPSKFYCQLLNEDDEPPPYGEEEIEVHLKECAEEFADFLEKKIAPLCSQLHAGMIAGLMDAPEAGSYPVIWDDHTVGKKSVLENKVEWKELDHTDCLTPKIVSVSTGHTFFGMVAHVQNPGIFFCQQTVNGCKLSQLQVSLREYCENTSITPDFCPAVGDVCCAQFTGDDKWYRALVLEINVSEVKVVYADYGNVEMLPFSRLQPITSPYLQLPFQILKCSLAGIMGLDGTWSISAIGKLNSLLMNKHVIITVKDVTQNIYTVIVQKKSENRVVDIAEQLIIENLAKYSSNGNLDLEKLEKLMIELADYCCAEKDSIFQPKIGEPCCAR